MDINYITDCAISVVCKINRFYNTYSTYIYEDINNGAPLLRNGILPSQISKEKEEKSPS